MGKDKCFQKVEIQTSTHKRKSCCLSKAATLAQHLARIGAVCSLGGYEEIWEQTEVNGSGEEAVDVMGMWMKYVVL